MNSQNQSAKSPKDYLTDYLKRLEDGRDRLRAWDYCYEAFQKVINEVEANPDTLNFDYPPPKKKGVVPSQEVQKKEEVPSPEDPKKEECIDYLALHLGVYMAHWGMLRGKSFLREKNYTIHKPIVLELLQSKYRALYGMGIDELSKDENAKLLNDLIKELKRLYKEERYLHSNVNRKLATRDLVVTKVVLGAMGCFPALDRFVLAALKSSAYNPIVPQGVKRAAKPLLTRKEQIKAFKAIYDELVYPALEEIRKDEKNKYSKASGYPEMKYVDMYLWECGKALSDKTKTPGS